MGFGKKKKEKEIEKVNKQEINNADILKAVFDNNKSPDDAPSIEETIAAMNAREKRRHKTEKEVAESGIDVETIADYKSEEIVEPPPEVVPKSDAQESDVSLDQIFNTGNEPTQETTPEVEATDGNNIQNEEEVSTAPVMAGTENVTTNQEVTVQERQEVDTTPETEPATELSKAQKELLASRERELQDIIYTIENPGAAPPKHNEEKKKKRVVGPRRAVSVPKKKRTLIFNRSLSNASIILIVSGIILIVLTVILILTTSIKTRNGATVDMGKKIIVKNPINNYVLKVLEVTNRVVIDKVNKSSTGNNSDYFVRIKINMVNRKKSVAAVRGTNEFRIYSQTNQYLADCYTANDLMDYNVTSAFPSSLQPKTEAEGYLYCKTDINYFPILEITALKEIDQSAANRGEIVGSSSYSFYVDLSQ